MCRTTVCRSTSSDRASLWKTWICPKLCEIGFQSFQNNFCREFLKSDFKIVRDWSSPGTPPLQPNVRKLTLYNVIQTCGLSTLNCFLSQNPNHVKLKCESAEIKTNCFLSEPRIGFCLPCWILHSRIFCPTTKKWSQCGKWSIYEVPFSLFIPLLSNQPTLSPSSQPKQLLLF